MTERQGKLAGVGGMDVVAGRYLPVMHKEAWRKWEESKF